MTTSKTNAAVTAGATPIITKVLISGGHQRTAPLSQKARERIDRGVATFFKRQQEGDHGKV